MTIAQLITAELFMFIKVVAIIFMLLHLIWSVILWRQTFTATSLVRTRNRNIFRFLTTLHILFLAGTLFLITLY